MPSRGDERPSAHTDEPETADGVDEELVERLRALEWPKPEPGQAARAFERFKARLEQEGD